MLSNTPPRRLTPRDIRVKMAEHDISRKEFSRLADVAGAYLGNILHERVPMGELVEIKVSRAIEALDSGQVPSGAERRRLNPQRSPRRPRSTS